MARTNKLTAAQAVVLCLLSPTRPRRIGPSSGEAAQRGFEAALAVVHNDGPSATLLKRIDALQAGELAEDWDGARHMDQK